MYVPASENNVALAHAVNNRIGADANYVHAQGVMLSARAWLWRFAGLGAFVLLSGIGVGAAFFGYSYYSDSRTSADKMASAFATALEHANLGTVKLDHQQTIEVTGTVAMTPGTVSLEPGGTVRVIGDIPRPTDRQLNGASLPANGGSPPSKVVTDYTIFKMVSFGNGSVKTGWDFTTSEQQYPTRQFCYYDEPAAAGILTMMNLALNGKMLDTALAYKSIDARMAASRCQWFEGGPTQ
jgi:hypothetical protein